MATNGLLLQDLGRTVTALMDESQIYLAQNTRISAEMARIKVDEAYHALIRAPKTWKSSGQWIYTVATYKSTLKATDAKFADFGIFFRSNMYNPC